MKNITINEVRTFLAENRKFWAQGCSTGGHPSALNREAVTKFVQAVNVAEISDDDIECAIDGVVGCYGEDATPAMCARDAIAFAGESAAANAGYDVDGYSVEITF